MKIIDQNNFKGTFKGKEVSLFTLKNSKGMIVQLTNFGAKIVSIIIPGSDGKNIDIMQGYETLDEWIKGMPYFGAICGRYANRIAKGKFTIDGTEYQLPINNGPNSLHGGPEGFNNQVFDAEEIIEKDGSSSIKMNYLSVDGEEGYPGNLNFSVTYTLTEDNELKLDYYGTTDKATHINICSHGFFNLAGCKNTEISSHSMMINASTFTPYDENAIPTGEIKSVEGTPMDFQQPQTIGDRIDDDFDQLKYGVGYDHNWILDKPLNELGLAAVYTEPASGRKMEVYTTQPGMQFYTANWHDGSDVGKGGTAYTKRSALCFETQNYPDSPNKPKFPSTLLKPGEEYKHTCIYKLLY
jgi:aldose 1-epimerase